MRLTALDIHHKEFRHSVVNGYRQDEVDKFLDEVADEFERLFKENIDLNERLEQANEKVRAYAEMERTLHNTMLAAQRSAEEIVEKSRREAEDVLRDAEVKAKEIIHNALSAKQRNQAELLRIKEAEEDFRSRFRALLDDYRDRLQEVTLPEDVRIMTAQAGDEKLGEVAIAPETVERMTAAPLAPSIPDFSSEPEVAVEPEPEVASAPGLFDQEADLGDTQAWNMPEAPEDPFDLIRQPDVQESEPERRGEDDLSRWAAPPAPTSQDHEPPASGFVSGLHLGEVDSPDLGPEEPTFEPPREFDMPSFSSLGERDDDVDIEEID